MALSTIANVTAPKFIGYPDDMGKPPHVRVPGFAKRLERVRQLLGSDGQPASFDRFAKMFGVSRSAAQQWAEEKYKKYPTIDKLVTIHKLSGVSLDWLVANTGPMKSVRGEFVKIEGEIGAGIWRSFVANQSSDDLTDKYGELPWVRERPFLDHEHFALRVEGDSVNKAILDGSYAICVRYKEVRPEKISGEMVAVQRHQGGTTESTIKILKKEGGSWLLYPYSTNPNFQKPLELIDAKKNKSKNLEFDEEGAEVDIFGLVVGQFSRIGRF